MPFDATGFRDEGGDEPEEWHLPPRVLVALCVWMAVLWVVLAVFVRTGWPCSGRIGPAPHLSIQQLPETP